MLLSELISKLEEFKIWHGDLPVYGACDDGYVEFTLDLEDNVLVKEEKLEQSCHPELYPPELYPKRVVIGNTGNYYNNLNK
jgi:hypothetical protein